MSSPADVIYNLIKTNETHFPIPAPYVTVNVGTFDATAGTFTGLTTTTDFDPEPIEHTSKQKPSNPAPKFQGLNWVSVTVNSRWQQTITSTPAPKVPLAPVLLQFSIARPTAAWSVVANGVTVNAPSTQSTLTVGVWDAMVVTWTVQCGAKSHTDTIRFQRPAGASDYGVGAFTIPIVPVSIIYAPPADSLNKSVASYLQGKTLASTVTNSFATDSNQTVPNGQAQYAGLGDFTSGLSTISQFLGLLTSSPGGISAADAAAYAAGSKIISAISAQLGKFTSTIQTGVTNTTDTTMTVTETTTDTISTLANAGGHGVGDVLHFFKNVRMAWSLLNGQMKLTPLGYTETAFPVGSIQKNLATLGISAADAAVLLALDPFVAGGPQAALTTDRFTFMETWEYGFGTALVHTVSATSDTKNTTTQKSYTIATSEWDPGPIFQLLGFGGKNQTTTTVTNATGTDASTVTTLNANLVSGPADHFIVNLWFDNLFGTFAFQEGQISVSARVTGTGATPGQQITLTAANQVFRTVADQNGKFVFWSTKIPAGSAMLAMGSQAAKSVTVATM
jgi:hypothetical protein